MTNYTNTLVEWLGGLVELVVPVRFVVVPMSGDAPAVTCCSLPSATSSMVAGGGGVHTVVKATFEIHMVMVMSTLDVDCLGTTVSGGVELSLMVEDLVIVITAEITDMFAVSGYVSDVSFVE